MVDFYINYGADVIILMQLIGKFIASVLLVRCMFIRDMEVARTILLFVIALLLFSNN